MKPSPMFFSDCLQSMKQLNCHCLEALVFNNDFFMCVGVLLSCLCTKAVPGASGSQKRMTDLQKVVGHDVGAKTRIQDYGGAIRALSHWAISRPFV